MRMIKTMVLTMPIHPNMEQQSIHTLSDEFGKKILSKNQISEESVGQRKRDLILKSEQKADLAFFFEMLCGLLGQLRSMNCSGNMSLTQNIAKQAIIQQIKNHISMTSQQYYQNNITQILNNFSKQNAFQNNDLIENTMKLLQKELKKNFEIQMTQHSHWKDNKIQSHFSTSLVQNLYKKNQNNFSVLRKGIKNFQFSSFEWEQKGVPSFLQSLSGENKPFFSEYFMYFQKAWNQKKLIKKINNPIRTVLMEQKYQSNKQFFNTTRSLFCLFGRNEINSKKYKTINSFLWNTDDKKDVFQEQNQNIYFSSNNFLSESLNTKRNEIIGAPFSYLQPKIFQKEKGRNEILGNVIYVENKHKTMVESNPFHKTDNENRSLRHWESSTWYRKKEVAVNANGIFFQRNTGDGQHTWNLQSLWPGQYSVFNTNYSFDNRWLYEKNLFQNFFLQHSKWLQDSRKRFQVSDSTIFHKNKIIVSTSCILQKNNLLQHIFIHALKNSDMQYLSETNNFSREKYLGIERNQKYSTWLIPNKAEMQEKWRKINKARNYHRYENKQEVFNIAIANMVRNTNMKYLSETNNFSREKYLGVEGIQKHSTWFIPNKAEMQEKWWKVNKTRNYHRDENKQEIFNIALANMVRNTNMQYLSETNNFSREKYLGVEGIQKHSTWLIPNKEEMQEKWRKINEIFFKKQFLGVKQQFPSWLYQKEDKFFKDLYEENRPLSIKNMREIFLNNELQGNKGLWMAKNFSNNNLWYHLNSYFQKSQRIFFFKNRERGDFPVFINHKYSSKNTIISGVNRQFSKIQRDVLKNLIYYDSLRTLFEPKQRDVLSRFFQYEKSLERVYGLKDSNNEKRFFQKEIWKFVESEKQVKTSLKTEYVRKIQRNENNMMEIDSFVWNHGFSELQQNKVAPFNLKLSFLNLHFLVQSIYKEHQKRMVERMEKDKDFFRNFNGNRFHVQNLHRMFQENLRIENNKIISNRKQMNLYSFYKEFSHPFFLPEGRNGKLSWDIQRKQEDVFLQRNRIVFDNKKNSSFSNFFYPVAWKQRDSIPVTNKFFSFGKKETFSFQDILEKNQIFSLHQLDKQGNTNIMKRDLYRQKYNMDFQDEAGEEVREVEQKRIPPNKLIQKTFWETGKVTSDETLKVFPQEYSKKQEEKSQFSKELLVRKDFYLQNIGIKNAKLEFPSGKSSNSPKSLSFIYKMEQQKEIQEKEIERRIQETVLSVVEEKLSERLERVWEEKEVKQKKEQLGIINFQEEKLPNESKRSLEESSVDMDDIYEKVYEKMERALRSERRRMGK